MGPVSETTGAYEFLERLRTQGSRQKPTFDSLMEYLDVEAKNRGIPLRGQFELTPLCNFDCKMCYTHLTADQLHGRKLLTVDQWKSLMRQAWEAGMMSVNLTGGECLAYPGFEELYLFLRDLGCEISVLTNGSLLDERWTAFFKEHCPHMIQVTLYGGNEDAYERVTGHRCFQKVSENLRRAISEDLPVVITTTPSKYSGEDIFQTVRVAKSFGVFYTVNGYLSEPKEETGRSGQDHDISVEEYAKIFRLFNELEGFECPTIAPEKLPPPGGPYHQWTGGCGLTCKAGQSCFTIEWDGKLYPCSSIRNIWAEPLSEGFRKAWESIHERSLQWPVIPECVECPYRSACTNCAVEKERFAEPGKQPFALCERTRYLVQCGVKRIPACE